MLICPINPSSVQTPSVRSGQVISAKRHQFALRGHDVNATIPETFQVKVPSVLKGHGRHGKGVLAGLKQEIIQGHQL